MSALPGQYAFVNLTCQCVLPNPPQPKDGSKLRGSYQVMWEDTGYRGDVTGVPRYDRYETLGFELDCKDCLVS